VYSKKLELEVHKSRSIFGNFLEDLKGKSVLAPNANGIWSRWFHYAGGLAPNRMAGSVKDAAGPLLPKPFNELLRVE